LGCHFHYSVCIDHLFFQIFTLSVNANVF
jgi:hypothetical protein